MHTMQVFGHRGAAGEAPENTIAGCVHAIDRGVRCIEIDLQFSSDREIMIVHDGTVDRTTQCRGKVDSYTARELQHMDARAFGPLWPQKKYAQIPSLESLLRATPEIQKYQLEVKPGSRNDMRAIAKKLADRFESKKEAKRIIITSSNSHVLTFVKEFAPHIQRGIVATNKRDLNTAIKLELEYFCAKWDLCTRLLVRKAHQHDMHVSCWTVNDPLIVRKLYTMGVDSVITDYPSMAIPLVGSLMRPK